MVYSMTGFARKEQAFEWAKLLIEIRSVNHRFLDISFKMPDEMRVFEMALKERLGQSLKRGKVEVSIKVFLDSAGVDKIAYDEELVNKLSKTLHNIDRQLYNAAPVRSLDVLSWPGVLVTEAGMGDSARDDLLGLMDNALQDLLEGRSREGEALKEMIVTRLDEIKDIVNKLSEHIPEILGLQRNKIVQKLEDAQVRYDPERLEQEMVLIAQKMDVEEELGRILTHLIEVRHVMEKKDGEAIGRRLDFLMQELNREANTLGSKSLSTITTSASVDLKVLIEQMREQIQNIE